eukprot:5532915-Amphidinium_carterae.1
MALHARSCWDVTTHLCALELEAAQHSPVDHTAWGACQFACSQHNVHQAPADRSDGRMVGSHGDASKR